MPGQPLHHRDLISGRQSCKEFICDGPSGLCLANPPLQRHHHWEVMLQRMHISESTWAIPGQPNNSNINPWNLHGLGFNFCSQPPGDQSHDNPSCRHSYRYSPAAKSGQLRPLDDRGQGERAGTTPRRYGIQ